MADLFAKFPVAKYIESIMALNKRNGEANYNDSIKVIYEILVTIILFVYVRLIVCARLIMCVRA